MTPTERLDDALQRLAAAEQVYRDASLDLEVAKAEVATLRRHVDGGAARPGALTDRILDTVADGQVRRPAEIFTLVSALDSTVDAASVRATLSQLVAAGRLVRPARGRYRLPGG